MRSGDEATARRLQAGIEPLAAWLGGPHGIARLKAGLSQLSFDHGPPRPPLPSATAEERETAHALLAGAGLLPGVVPRAS
jgi:4-hydroxy-tetrahydrodipicolinate synthase